MAPELPSARHNLTTRQPGVVECLHMKAVLPDYLGLGFWAILSIPIVWVGLTYVWGQVIGERDAGANLIITGLAVVWAVALSSWF